MHVAGPAYSIHGSRILRLRLWEIAGWFLILLALALVWMALGYVESRQVVEGSVVVFAATVIFRGGILLIRIATAARICLSEGRREDS